MAPARFNRITPPRLPDGFQRAHRARGVKVGLVMLGRWRRRRDERLAERREALRMVQIFGAHEAWLELRLAMGETAHRGDRAGNRRFTRMRTVVEREAVRTGAARRGANLCKDAAWLGGLLLALYGAPVQAETVAVKYRGMIDLDPYECEAVTTSSFVERVCFDEARSSMVIRLNGTYYEYCGIDGGTVAALLSAESIGRYYRSAIRSDANGGRFDCRRF